MTILIDDTKPGWLGGFCRIEVKSPTGKIGIIQASEKRDCHHSRRGTRISTPHWFFTVPPPLISRAYSFSSKPSIIMYKLAIASLLATSAAAFAPAQSAGRASTSLNLNGWTADEVRDIKSSEKNF